VVYREATGIEGIETACELSNMISTERDCTVYVAGICKWEISVLSEI
jgi:hypothetical protein